MRFPFVSRERYDEKCAELADLKAAYHALLTERAKPSAEPRPPKPPRDPMVDKLTADLKGVMGDDAAARAEAERIKREAFGGVL